jgi:hypothetical protein
VDAFMIQNWSQMKAELVFKVKAVSVVGQGQQTKD